MFGVSLSSHLYLRGPIILLKNQSLTTLSLIYLILLVYIGNNEIKVKYQAIL
jgi:hypothetical protein